MLPHGSEVAVNPPGVDAGYLGGLQESFPGWGTPADFDWWFRRSSGGPCADLIVLRRAGDTVAGIAVAYRLLAENRGLAAILSAAWTTPAAREQGVFTALVEQARLTACSRHAAVLLAFVSHGRKSAAVLTRAADAMLPTWTLGHEAVGDPAARIPGPAGDALRAMLAPPPGSCGFRYPDAAAFAAQARLGEARTSVARLEAGGAAILHEAGTTRVEAISGELEHVLGVCHGPVSAFTTDPDRARAAIAAGWSAQPGHLFVRSLDGRAFGNWALHGMDRA